jgi:hypothetical protein
LTLVSRLGVLALALAAAESELLVLPQATHEALPYDFAALARPVDGWLGRHAAPRAPAAGPPARRFRARAGRIRLELARDGGKRGMKKAKKC